MRCHSFFVSSGFLLFKKIEQNKIDSKIIKQYVGKMLRLYTIWTAIYGIFIVKDLVKTTNSLADFCGALSKRYFIVGSYWQLWYLGATAVAVAIVAFFLKKRFSIVKILIIGIVLYLLGLLGQTYFGLIRPLKVCAPELWHILKVVKDFMQTTRNGVFEGVLFVAIGMFFAYRPIRVQRGLAIVFILLSFGAFLVEVLLIDFFRLARACDMYLCLIPVVFWLFYVVIHEEVPASGVYLKLRTMSMLIFYIHVWVDKVIGFILKMVSEEHAQSALRFLLTLILSLAGSVFIINIAKIEKFKWIKFLYT